MATLDPPPHSFTLTSTALELHQEKQHHQPAFTRRKYSILLSLQHTHAITGNCREPQVAQKLITSFRLPHPHPCCDSGPSTRPSWKLLSAGISTTMAKARYAFDQPRSKPLIIQANPFIRDTTQKEQIAIGASSAPLKLTAPSPSPLSTMSTRTSSHLTSASSATWSTEKASSVLRLISEAAATAKMASIASTVVASA